MIFISTDINSRKDGKVKRTFKPGEKALVSGQYRLVGTKREVTVAKKEPIPPAPKKGMKFRLVDQTKHK